MVKATYYDGVNAERYGAEVAVAGPRSIRVNPSVGDPVEIDADELAVADEDEAVAVANGVPYGLVGSVFTRDLDRALGLAARLDTGMIRVNAPTSGVDFHAPFGGEKDSSHGPREQGKAAQEFYTSTHTVALGPAGS